EGRVPYKGPLADTVHQLVGGLRAGMDTGPIIAQEAVVVSDGDTRESLQKKIQQVEHKLYVNTVNQIVQSVKEPTVN
ncbi:formyltransferase family protein, partial [Bacillus sp. B-TM1]